MLKLKHDRPARVSWCSASREDLEAAVQCLRDNFIAYIGPFVIKTNVAVFRVTDYLLTADELVYLHKSGHLCEEGLAKFGRDEDPVEMQLASKHRGQAADSNAELSEE